MKGLILAGGENSRLGREKAFLNLHGESQIAFLSNEFSKLDIESFVSIPFRKKQAFSKFRIIIDDDKIRGPLSGIFAAFEHDPGPWIIIAVDMPFIDGVAINFLLKNRKPAVATCFSIDMVNPEPLAAIWEKEAGKLLQEYVDNSADSPLQFLLMNKANLVKPLENNWVKSINTEDDLLLAKKTLTNQDNED